MSLELTLNPPSKTFEGIRIGWTENTGHRSRGNYFWLGDGDENIMQINYTTGEAGYIIDDTYSKSGFLEEGDSLDMSSHFPNRRGVWPVTFEWVNQDIVVLKYKYGEDRYSFILPRFPQWDPNVKLGDFLS